MPQSWVLKIRRAPPSANVFMRMHWAKRSREGAHWAWMLMEAGSRDIPKATGKRWVNITIWTPVGRDFANLWLAADKLILDNLVKYGILKDDSPKWLKCEIRAERGPAKVEIEIRE